MCYKNPEKPEYKYTGGEDVQNFGLLMLKLLQCGPAIDDTVDPKLYLRTKTDTNEESKYR